MSSNYPKRNVTLSRLLGRVSELFEEQITPHEVWVKAEVSSFKKHVSGHLYFDLVEEINGVQIARCRAVIWRSHAESIALRSNIQVSNFLEDGREILCLARIIYHPVFGLSLQITDVDSSFALGEIEKRKRECVARMKKEGLLTLNKALHLPPVVQRIAILAAEGSAGLADLLQQLNQNRYGYKFDCTHFQTSVQGKEAIESLHAAFTKISKYDFDAIVLIRGGGSALDLDVFNHYELNAFLAQASLPFIVGIGHETDRTVIDEWAHVSLKTPSAVGAWIVERAREFDIQISTHFSLIVEVYRSRMESLNSRLAERSQGIIRYTREVHSKVRIELTHTGRALAQLSERKIKLQHEFRRQFLDHLKSESKLALEGSKFEMTTKLEGLDRFCREIVLRSKHQLQLTGELIQVYHPENTLKRGYNVLRVNNTIVVDADMLDIGESVEIETFTHLLETHINKISRKDGK